jgi:hypothetical protein
MGLYLVAYLVEHSVYTSACECKSHLAEDDVVAIQPRRGHGADEELGAVGVGARIRHAAVAPNRRNKQER